MIEIGNNISINMEEEINRKSLNNVNQDKLNLSGNEAPYKYKSNDQITYQKTPSIRHSNQISNFGTPEIQRDEMIRVGTIKSDSYTTADEKNKNLLSSINDNNKYSIHKDSYLDVEDNSHSKYVNPLDNKFNNHLFESNDILDKQENKDNNEYIIQIQNIHKSYLIGVEGVPALRGVSLNIKFGEFLVILGTSGGGKTTLLNVLGTIDAPTRGNVKIFDSSIKSDSKDEFLSFIRLKEVAFVFQSFNLLSNMNVVENVELPMKILGELSSNEIRERAIELLEKVGLGKRLWHFPNQLSGGEQQRVTIARALSNKPKILLLDEPTGDLDTKNSDVVMNILIDLNLNEQITMIMVTHDVGLKTFGHRVVRMMDGKVQTIYDIEKQDRAETIVKLKERVKANSFELREGAETACVSNKGKNTYVRKIEDYKIISKRFVK